MKKSFLLLLLSVLTLTGFAQKTHTVVTTTAQTQTKYQNTQARMPQVLVQPIIQPLIGEVEVLPGREHKFMLPISSSKLKELESQLVNVQNYGIYMWTDKENCDMIVGATYNFYSNDSGDGYTLEIKGFPANFKAWRSCNEKDYEWMRITGAQGAGNRAVQPVVK
jgi:hypothetical protein